MSAVEKFWDNVRKGDGCWLWMGSRSDQGYGFCGGMGAHHFSYELHWGPIPPGLILCHECDNPPCVNPFHLYVGTYQDNRRDAVRLGLPYRGKMPAFALEPNGFAKFIEAWGGMEKFAYDAVLSCWSIRDGLKKNTYSVSTCRRLEAMGVELVDKPPRPAPLGDHSGFFTDTYTEAANNLFLWFVTGKRRMKEVAFDLKASPQMVRKWMDAKRIPEPGYQRYIEKVTDGKVKAKDWTIPFQLEAAE